MLTFNFSPKTNIEKIKKNLPVSSNNCYINPIYHFFQKQVRLLKLVTDVNVLELEILYPYNSIHLPKCTSVDHCHIDYSNVWVTNVVIHFATGQEPKHRNRPFGWYLHWPVVSLMIISRQISNRQVQIVSNYGNSYISADKNGDGKIESRGQIQNILLGVEGAFSLPDNIILLGDGQENARQREE